LAWDILGDLLTPDHSIWKAICLVGEWGNGKSAFLDLAANFVGTENVCHLSLQRLELDRFSAARLYGKLANICPDLPSDRLSSSAMFKSITGCDHITAEFKYRDSFEFTPVVRLLFSANQLPPSNETAQAFFYRWLIVSFPNRFRHTRRETPRSILQHQLCARGELSGALNKALAALQRVRLFCRFKEPAKSRIDVEKYQAAKRHHRRLARRAHGRIGRCIIPQSELHAA